LAELQRWKSLRVKPAIPEGGEEHGQVPVDNGGS
jgi:hypothetical protein